MAHRNAASKADYCAIIEIPGDIANGIESTQQVIAEDSTLNGVESAAITYLMEHDLSFVAASIYEHGIYSHMTSWEPDENRDELLEELRAKATDVIFEGE